MAQQFMVVIKRESAVGGAAMSVRIDIDGVRSPIELKCGEAAHMAMEQGIHKIELSFWGVPKKSIVFLDVSCNRTISCKGRTIGSGSLFLDPIFIYDETGAKVNGKTSRLPYVGAQEYGATFPVNPPQQQYSQPIQQTYSKPRIQGVSGCFNGKRFAFSDKIRLGRNPNNDIVYPAASKGISGFHCELIFLNGKIYITDLGSTYGTFVRRGERIAANQPVELFYGDAFWLGSESEKFVIAQKN